MPAKLDETREIFRWLAREISPDTWVNVMAQYRPEYKVGTKGGGGETRYAEINRRPLQDEIERAYELAREAGLWRFDAR